MQMINVQNFLKNTAFLLMKRQDIFNECAFDLEEKQNIRGAFNKFTDFFVLT